MSLVSIILHLLLFGSSVFILFVLWLKKRYRYWNEQGLENSPIDFFFSKTLSQQVSFNDNIKETYDYFKERNLKYGGTFFFYKPSFVAVDPNIIKHVTHVDFHNFVDRGLYLNEKADPLGANLLALEGQKWKTLRAKLSPTFTSGRMKMMLDTLIHCSDGLVDVLDSLEDQVIDIKDVLARFTTDVIGSCAFGIECDSLKDPGNDFRTKGSKVFSVTVMEGMKALFAFMSPGLAKKLNVAITRPDLTEFFTNVVKDTVEYREKNNIYRKDFMHLLIQLKNRGRIVDDEKLFLQENEQIGPDVVDINEMAAQCFIFFLGGFETSSSLMSFCLYELSINKHVQVKLRQEINQVLQRHNGKITYDALKEMHYMENVLNETLRKYPPIGSLQRFCNADYKVPDSNFILKKGTAVTIPIYGLHRDERYYPDPEKFDPDRFTEENKKSRPAYTFLPFGEGPRMCIGLRFGLLQAKVGLTVTVKNFEIELNKKTISPIVMDPANFLSAAKGGIWLNMKKIDNN